MYCMYHKSTVCRYRNHLNVNDLQLDVYEVHLQNYLRLPPSDFNVGQNIKVWQNDQSTWEWLGFNFSC